MSTPEYKPPVCIWCNTPWSDEMLKVEAYTSAGCPTCGHGSTTSGEIEITCSNCDRVVYKKEFELDH